MNVIGLREAKARLAEVARRAQRGQRALVTRRGKPCFVIVGVEGDDLLDVLIRWDPQFWKELDRRRKRSARNSVSLDELERELRGRRKTRGSK